MEPLRKSAVLLTALALLLGACGITRNSGRAESGAASRFTPTPAGATGAGDAPATVRIHGLRLKLGEETGGDRARVMINNSAPNLRITLTGNLDQEQQAVTVCSVSGETELPPSTQCILPVAGRPVDLPAGSNIKGVEISLAGRSTAVDLEEVAITFTAIDRRVRMLLPDLEPRGDDPVCLPKGCPSFEMTPQREGILSAQASWREPGSGLLDIRTAIPPPTGISPTPPAFTVTSSSTSASSAGPGSVSTSAPLRSEGRSILALTNNGDTPLDSPVVEATWP